MFVTSTSHNRITRYYLHQRPAFIFVCFGEKPQIYINISMRKKDEQLRNLEIQERERVEQYKNKEPPSFQKVKRGPNPTFPETAIGIVLVCLI